jgi:hypothetical protein
MRRKARERALGAPGSIMLRGALGRATGFW